MLRRLNINLKYLVACILMLLFVINDLVFDFLFDFETSDYISFVFTLLASIITFICTYRVVRSEIECKADKMSAFIKCNFNNWQVIFSTLDIICGIISILSGLVFLGGVFKFVKLFYIPIKFVVVLNKSKSVLKGLKTISKISLIWSGSRLLKKTLKINNLDFKGENRMKTWIKNNKLTITYCFGFGALSSFVGYVLSTKFLKLPFYANILIGVACFILICIFTVILGADNLKSAIFRNASKVLKDTNFNTAYDKIKELINQQELEAIAEKELAEEKEKAEAELKKANAEKLKAEKENKKIEKQQVKTAEINAEKEAEAKAEAEKRAIIEKIKAELKAKENTQN